MSLPRGRAAPSVGELRDRHGDLTDLFTREAPPWHLPGSRVRPNVLAFDPGEHTGVALLTAEGKLSTTTIRARHGRFDRDWGKAVHGVLAQLQGLIATPSLVIVEEPYLGSASRTPLAALSGARYAGALTMAATYQGWPVWRMASQVWQSRMLPTAPRGGPKGAARAFLKAASIRIAGQTFGATLKEHEADAALMALFVRGRS